MQGIFAGRTQLRYPYGRYGYTRGGGKIWHGGMDLVGLDSTDIRMPYYKNKRITGKVVRARRVTDHSNKTWEWGWYVCVQLDPGQTPDDVNYLYFCHCRELKVTAGQAVASGDLLAVMGQSGNAAGGYDHCHFEARATAAGKGLDPSQYAGCPNAVGVYGEAPGQADPGEENEKKADAAKKLQRISIGPVSGATPTRCMRCASAAGWWPLVCTKVNGVFEYERKFGQEKRFFICKSRRGRAVRGLYGGVWMAGLAGAGLGGLHGAGLAERQRGRRQQGRVVQRGSPRGDLAQSRHGGGRLRSGVDRLGFKRGGGKPAGVWGWCWV